jgi:hypothetical protein
MDNQWWVVVLKDIQSDGKKTWAVFSEHPTIEEAQVSAERCRVEGFMAHVVKAAEE